MLNRPQKVERPSHADRSDELAGNVCGKNSAEPAPDKHGQKQAAPQPEHDEPVISHTAPTASTARHTTVTPLAPEGDASSERQLEIYGLSRSPHPQR